MKEDWRKLIELNIMERILDSFYDGLTYTDENGIIVFNNKAYSHITGISDEDILGKSVYDLDKRGYPISKIAIEVFQTKQTISKAIKYRKNSVEEVLVTVGPVFDDNNIFRGIVANVRDLTGLNNLRKELSLISAKYNEEVQKQEDINRKLQIEKDKNNRLQAQINELVNGFKDLEVAGKSKHIQNLTELAFRISNAKSSVLITGESGVGKDVFSKMVHKFHDQSKPFIKISCGAIPENLMESELFGYEPGAFTGASKGGKKGIFELAQDGTIFLDEVGELTLPLQVKLLTVLQDRKFFRIGGTKEIKMEARIISATNRNLKEGMKNGIFRTDLYYRLNVIPVYISPLRERKEDIIPIANSILKKLNSNNNRNVKISFDLQKVLESYDWPGNIRELNNIIERMYVFSSDDTMDIDNLPEELRKIVEENQIISQFNNCRSLKDSMDAIEANLILKRLNPNLTLKEISDSLGINISTLERKMNKYNLPRRYKKNRSS